MLSRNVKVMASDGHSIFNQEHSRINPSKNIFLSNNVWLADNVTILKGTIIGAYSIVGINSTLTNSIPENSIAVGNPAHIIANDIYWKQ
jgi:acetyltransferase-like isoleucine patch superfamily enzyme